MRSTTQSLAGADITVKEGKTAVTWTRLSCTRFAANAARLQLHALAYDVSVFHRLPCGAVR